MIELKAALIQFIIESKMPIVMGLQFLVHKAASYYVSDGRKSLKGFIKFLIGKNDEPKA